MQYMHVYKCARGFVQICVYMWLCAWLSVFCVWCGPRRTGGGVRGIALYICVYTFICSDV